jgi:peptide/nickel transport system permease protein
MIKTFLRNRTAAAGLVLLFIIVPLALLSPVLAPYDPNAQHLGFQLQAPTGHYLLGTDDFGRDLLSRILLGGQVSIFVGIASVLLGVVIGVPFGLFSGYYGGKVDATITRFVDVLMSFPPLLIGLMVLAALGPGIPNLIISIAAAFAPRFVRMARAPTMAVKERDFVTACRAVGMSDKRILIRHVLPNILGDVVVMTTLWTATAIRLEANLSFIGIGVQPPTPSWGVMIRNGVNYLTNAPWICIFCGLAIMLTVLSFNLIGDGLRDVIDPKLRG